MAIKKVLVVDDSPTEALHLSEILGKGGFKVTVAADSDQAMAKLEAESFDLILMDVVMPGQNGYQATRAIKKDERFQDIPVIMCTTKGLETDRVWGMRQGASDYIVKPVQPRLLLARIKALLRRAPAAGGSAPPSDDDALAFGQFRISQATRTAHLGAEAIDLTTAEFDLLWLLARHAGNILSRDDLLQQLRGIGFDGLDRSIDARISRLRKKLGDDPDNPTRIKTVRGKGYLFSRHDWQ